MSIENSENPIRMVVTHSRAVFQKTLRRLSVDHRPQKHRAKSATMKKAAPLLYGRPNTLTNSRSMYAAIFGRYGMNRKFSTPRITTPTAKILTSSQKVKGPSSRWR